MDLMKLLLSHTRRAVDKYAMIPQNARVLCAVSGGKDSLALMTVMKRLSEFHPAGFSVYAMTVDPGFGADLSPVVEYAREISVPFDIMKTDIAAAVEKEASPCALCARLRRGAILSYAREHGFSLVALGHTEDDLGETVLMNLLFAGKFEGFDPVTKYEDKGVTLIRPFIETPGRTVSEFSREYRLPTVKNPCPADTDSQRQTARGMLKEADRVCRGSAHRAALAYLKTVR